MLFLSALVLLGGAAGDVFGVRNIFAGGIAVFMVTSLACAIAPDADSLILMRALQGVGAAFMVPGSLAIIAKSYPPETRGRAIGSWAAFSSLTTAAGPFVGGIMLSFGEDWMWRLIFAINVPIGFMALTMLFAKVPRDRPATRRQLDYAGALLATAGLGLIAWGLTGFGLPKGVVSPWAWVLAGIALFGLFIAWERCTRSPMVKLSLFRSKAFSGANLFTLVLFLAFNAILFFLPMTVVTAWGVSEAQAALLLLPLSLMIGAFSSRAGRLADRIGPRLPLTLGALLMAVSYAGLALTMPMMRIWEVTFPILLLHGAGMALLVSPLSTAVMLAVPDSDTGVASGVNNAVARAAGLMAVAALGAMASLVFSSVAHGVAGVEFGARPPVALDTASELLRIMATNRAFQTIAAVSSAMCVLAAIVGWLTQPSWTTPAPHAGQ
jgi:EmrB/QacA subfamily drug resistance transporter